MDLVLGIRRTTMMGSGRCCILAVQRYSRSFRLVFGVLVPVPRQSLVREFQDNELHESLPGDGMA